MKTIVVLGAGYAGLRVVRELVDHKANAKIVLINKNSYHYESTQLHEVAIGSKSPNDISLNIRDVIGNQVDFIEDEVVKIDRQNKKVELKSKSTVSYDYLVTCLGFESETFGIKGADEFGLPIIDIDTALVAKKRLEETLARFQSSHDENDLHIAVCGAGFTSIEYIGELLHRLPDFVKRFNLPAEKIKIYCIEAAPKVLPMFDPKLVDYAVNYLKNQGVEFYTETSITEVKKGAVISKDKAFNANTIIWTTGVKGSHVINDSGYTQKRNRVAVQNDLSSSDDPNEFIIGDVSAVPSPDGRFYPTTGQISVAQATLAASNIIAKLNNQKTSPFTYHSLGTVCSLGPTNGVAELSFMGHWKLKGHKVAPLKRIVNDRTVFELAGFKAMMSSK
ncbi:NAD(P)/FAD-dependent oxidoreductase [Oenococcus oeni]|uniref:FAD/NAD(P)-binding domain-containing protein n=8 Tax=Oenococcus oeni TaxID=1247 RepID=D3LC13_OENOE|nr:NAD(P)/FAD-dependent oxidoreductase [Oenococcus oeni]AWW98810.1 NAD(P)/FAD-dependent oxidoreductase [Oenococcus oeni]EFD87551.1 hypothetical protein AWRIB429_1893 [Oenococcus oeni AWRIB429]EJN91513.1 NADH dehydrogenase, FAD-containing subunit [Oenococcus oeni AWRIB304]EJN99670.1 NADH dehydrogenase, FAD-containing subunit [Oenococcus oeni AWRIB419]EJO03045.1 NADH dehydrogenase, FAD-containing subunit [Oenococcus oeni AWRIB318]